MVIYIFKYTLNDIGNGIDGLLSSIIIYAQDRDPCSAFLEL